MNGNLQIVSDQDLDQLTGLFRLLADKTRLSILMMLAQGEHNVTGLCEKLNLPQPTVSHHLGLLRTHNVIGNRRSGKQVFYERNGQDNSPDDGTVLAVNVENLCVHVVPRCE